MTRVLLLVILGLAVWAGFYLRFIDLAQKPMHTDEAVNGIMVQRSLLGEAIHFDPGHYHGPLLRYLAEITVQVTAMFTDGEALTESTLRWLTAFAGGCLVVSLILFKNRMGEDAAFIALVYTAVSPPLIYYSRYFIHESVFLLSSVLFLFFFWCFLKDRSWRSALLAGVAVGLTHALRETVVFVLAAAGVAAAVALRGSWRDMWGWVISREGRIAVSVFVLSAVGISVLFYSAFFTRWQGVLDSVLTYFHYETEPGHEKPWYYYLSLISGEQARIGYLGQGWLLLLGAAGCWRAFAVGERQGERTPFFQYLATYTLVTTVLYSIIPYKTPWLMLNFLIGWILMAGVGWVWLWSRFRPWFVRVLLVVVLLTTLGHSLRQSWLLGFRFSADPRNPFVYSHTSPDLLNLVERLNVLARLHPDGRAMRIDVSGAEYWPLPWYLRDFSEVGYWGDFQEESRAPVQVFSFRAGEEPPERDPEAWISDLRGLRDGVFLLAYIDRDLWERQFPDS